MHRAGRAHVMIIVEEIMRHSAFLTLVTVVLAGRTLAGEDTAARYDARAAANGAHTYKAYCAVCHGRTGHGDGPLSASLRVTPADLTRISKRNRGVFPFDKMAKIIDGREHVKGHGDSDMPVWGDAFLESREGYDEAKVKEKIRELAHYLASIQETAEASKK
jgi:mono/diheme cytochrome c family protein